MDICKNKDFLEAVNELNKEYYSPFVEANLFPSVGMLKYSLSKLANWLVISDYGNINSSPEYAECSFWIKDSSNNNTAEIIFDKKQGFKIKNCETNTVEQLTEFIKKVVNNLLKEEINN